MNKHATYQQLRSHLAYLKLTAAAEQLPAALEHAEKAKPGYTQFLADVLQVEVTTTEERRLHARLRLAGFPSTKTIEEFDFTAQPSIDRRLLTNSRPSGSSRRKPTYLRSGRQASARRCSQSRSA